MGPAFILLELFRDVAGAATISSAAGRLFARVSFDRLRARALPAILAEFERRGIYSIGRDGAWEHTSMEDAISQGKRLAERLQGLEIQRRSA